MKEIKISSEFKSQTTKSILAINLFIFTYFLMLAFAVGLTFLCVYAGIMIIVFKPMFITLALGIGLASLGVLVLIFLLKFIFKSHKIDRSHLIEIKQSDEPQIFQLINSIVKEVGTNFPKKVYLSSDVNASVFYDSSFWSMFFPVKKNLLIGLGLVNTVTKSELTAILSHEFGHFSQKSMKVGSYVYNLNQIIFNLLNDNESYEKNVQRWAEASGYFSIFVVIAFKIIDGIKWILKQMYAIVNKSYLALSREMEFHADEIAANVTGFEPLKSSLLRLSLADHSFNNVLSFYDRKIPDNLKSDNIFRDHLFVTNFFAVNNQIEIKNDLPQISGNELNKFNKSKLVVKDQWASHPSTEDRIVMLEKTGLHANDINNEPANTLFSNIDKIQEEFTQRIFNNVTYSGESSAISFDFFKSDFEKDYLENTFPKIYNAYYDNKNPIFFDINEVEFQNENITLEELFSDEIVENVYSQIALQNDIEAIKQISDKTFDIKTFDYDGIKYKKDNGKELIQKLEIELNSLNDLIKINDIKVYAYFKNLEKKANMNPTLEKLYAKFFDFDKNFDSKYNIYIQLSNELQFINFTTPIEQIELNFIKVRSLEKDLKQEIEEMLKNADFKSEMTKEIKESFEIYLSDEWEYFGTQSYYDNNLEKLFNALNNYAFLLSRGYFIIKKKLLIYQLDILKNSGLST